MKIYDGLEVLLHALLASALNGGERSVSRPGRINPALTGWEIGLTPEPVWSPENTESSDPWGNRISLPWLPILQISHYTDRAFSA
jgi:hypothetical protein